MAFKCKIWHEKNHVAASHKRKVDSLSKDLVERKSRVSVEKWAKSVIGMLPKSMWWIAFLQERSRNRNTCLCQFMVAF